MIGLILAYGINDHWKATVWIIYNANYIPTSLFSTDIVIRIIIIYRHCCLHCRRHV